MAIDNRNMTHTISRLSEREPEARGAAVETALEKKNRILIYGINYAPEPIGVGRYTGEIGRYLSQHGMDVEVITAAPHYPGWVLHPSYKNFFKVERVAEIRVTRCPIFLHADMRGWKRLLAPLSFAITSAPIAIWRILTERPDTILCIEPTLLVAPVALIFGKIIGARTVLHVQDLEVDAAFAVRHISGNSTEKIALWFERHLLKRFDFVLTISEQMRKRLEKKGVKLARLGVVRNWVDVDIIKPLTEPSSFRDELNISDTDFIVLYSGNIGVKQSLPVMLDAAIRLQNRSDILFLVVGDGPEKKKLLSAYGQFKNIRFLPLQPEARLCELLNLAGVHVLPQSEKTADLLLPSKLGGMLASGKPCIVMANSGTEMHEFLQGAALLIEPDNSDALGDAILMVKSFAGDDGNRERRLKLARELHSENNLERIMSIVNC